MEEAGLVGRVDAAGNLIGHYAALRADAPLLLIGSHLDTVPDAGKYDGVLGVMLGLAAVQALGGRRLPFGIDVIGVQRGRGCSLPCSVSGEPGGLRTIRPATARAHRPRRDHDGRSLSCLRARSGADRRGRLSRPAASSPYLEPHIEQGPVLESLGAPVGVVDAIAGQSRIWVELRGRAGHAGTMPMEGRRDALAAAAELVLEVERLARAVPGLRRRSARWSSSRERST